MLQFENAAWFWVLLPLLPAKQRDTHPNDWMTTDMEVACPDPKSGQTRDQPDHDVVCCYLQRVFALFFRVFR